MEETEHKSSFRPHVILTLLPLLALGTAVFWYVSRYRTGEVAGKEPLKPAFGGPASAARPAAGPGREKSGALSALDIQGSPAFKGRVTGALKLIWLADRETFLFIREQLFVIRSENKTDFYLDAGQPVAGISNTHAFRSLPWCAGIIAHQAYHSFAKLKNMKKNTFLPPPPGTETFLMVEADPDSRNYTSLDSMLAEERKASKFQVKILILAGASRAEILSVKKRAPRDFLTGHDGNYSLK